MKREIYYFSGTGNCLRVAQKLAECLEAALYPMTALMQGEVPQTDADWVGLVFPVYYGYPPVIVQEAAARLAQLHGKTIFALCTHGVAAMYSLRTLNNILRDNGGSLSLAYGIAMPENAFAKPLEGKKRKLASWTTRVSAIARDIENGGTGIHYQNIFVEWLVRPVLRFIVDPICEASFTKQCSLPKGTPMNEVIRKRDCGFSIKDTCIGCGICAKVCPVDNIRIENGKPIWEHRCENCLACYNWCPSQAINSGITSQTYYYRHPGVSLQEFISRQSSGVQS